MHIENTLEEVQNRWRGSYTSYLIGFAGALLITIAAFILAAAKPLPAHTLGIILVLLAFVQAIYQLIFFFHIGKEAKPRWNLFFFYSMIIVVVIIALGTLWIMFDLNERVMLNMTMEMSHD